MRNSCKKWILLLALLLAVTVGGGAMATSLSELTISQYRTLLSAQVPDAAPTVQMTVYSVDGVTPGNAESAVAAAGSEVIYQITVNSGSMGVNNAVLTDTLPENVYGSVAISTDGSNWTDPAANDNGCVTISNSVTMEANASATWYVKAAVVSGVASGTHTGSAALTLDSSSTITDSADIVISYLRIAKRVISSDGAAVSRSATAFTFEVWINTPGATYNYQVNGGETQQLVLDENGKGIISLRADDAIVFLDLEPGTPFTVQEINIPAGYTQTGLSVNGMEAAALMATASEDENTSATYDVMIINERPTYNLTIKNEVVGSDAPKDGENFTENFTFTVELDQEPVPSDGVTFELDETSGLYIATVSIRGAGEKIISGIQWNTTITVKSEAGDYTPSVNGDTNKDSFSSSSITENTEVMFTHTYNYGSMTIQVEGELDDHSFVFNVKGTADTATADIDLAVAINGSNTVTLTKLPVGNYTVREVSGWTWRYTGDQVIQNVIVEADGDIPVAEFTFANPTTQWLDDSSYHLLQPTNGGEQQ